jgi:hypothetical protein
MPCLINQCFTPGVALNQQITHPVARLPRSASSASSALSWGNSKPDVGHVKPNTSKYYQGCSTALFVGIFLATRGEGNPIVMGLGATRFWLDHFRSWTFTLQPFFDRETSPKWVNLGGDIEDGYPTKITRVYVHSCIPMDVEPLIV